MKDMGAIKRYLGIEFHQDLKLDEIFLSQRNYAEVILERVGMAQCKIVSTRMETNCKISSSHIKDEQVMASILISNLCCCLQKENSRKHLATNNVISINKDINHNRGQNLGQDCLSIIFNLEHNSTNHQGNNHQPPPEPMDTSSGNTAYRQPTSPNPFYHQPWKRGREPSGNYRNNKQMRNNNIITREDDNSSTIVETVDRRKETSNINYTIGNDMYRERIDKLMKENNGIGPLPSRQQ
ncbi:hypothetical protein EVAR_100846_1 [Eumeta japonica]|uniref:Reverse transcriptase Ty1/copia-type domain-containing protein n=1 Tax=Eumeta variegata TaxID=151549 RepID=A0A4C1TL32_EUMVA|nr:hypothetical protein EVAR_100846_1 [Eumeta japonica]